MVVCDRINTRVGLTWIRRQSDPTSTERLPLPMPANTTGESDDAAERAVVLRLLEDHDRPVSRDELCAERGDIGAERFAAAISALDAAEVLRVEGETIRSAPALQRLDGLRFIAI